MTPAIAPLQLLAVALNWLAAPGTTYTVQTSDNLVDWQTMPFVVSGNGQQESYPIDLQHDPSFARLQFNTNGDSNENSLPDLWEWGHFGHLNSDPNADPDGDGASTFEEWLESTDPTDFFNGATPVIRLSSGSEWLANAGEDVPQILSLGVFNLNGDPWPNAPIGIEFESGFAGILDELNSTAHDVIHLQTDPLGRLDSSRVALHFRAPDAANHYEIINITSGRACVRLTLHTIQALPGGPPRQLERKRLSDTDVEYQWSGSTEDVTRFRIEELDMQTGSWVELVAMMPETLPEPDPATGRFALMTHTLAD